MLLTLSHSCYCCRELLISLHATFISRPTCNNYFAWHVSRAIIIILLLLFDLKTTSSFSRINIINLSTNNTVNHVSSTFRTACWSPRGREGIGVHLFAASDRCGRSAKGCFYQRYQIFYCIDQLFRKQSTFLFYMTHGSL